MGLRLRGRADGAVRPGAGRQAQARRGAEGPRRSREGSPSERGRPPGQGARDGDHDQAQGSRHARRSGRQGRPRDPDQRLARRDDDPRRHRLPRARRGGHRGEAVARLLRHEALRRDAGPRRRGRPAAEYEWGVGEAFSKYAIWAAILTFLTSMMAEFLIWTQVVSYWTQDVGFSLAKATQTYAVIGLIGIFSMPIMGKIADKVVTLMGNEVKGRKVMLMVGPGTGVLACLFLLGTKQGDFFAYVACFIFAVYWAIVPGGVVGYTGAVYGRKTLGKIWGLATMIVMGIGPFLGSFIGGWLKDVSGSYTYSIYYALGSFVLSVVLATTLPLKAEPKVLVAGSPAIAPSRAS
ncbi:MAG: MFS transporter [Holophagales bacterium]|nr:MFS transporter [Holophagales bacterium]